MIAFYGDPDKSWAWRNAFDEADYGLGKTSSRLRPGAEAPANAFLLDGVIVDDMGKSKPLRDRIALYERDAGILWTHTDLLDNTTSTRRANELVVLSIATIGNYDYVLQWIFAEDGRLTFRMDLSGVMLTKGVRETRCAACDLPPDPAGRVSAGPAGYGTQVAPRLVAVYHQHFVNMRLDFDIDGSRNALREIELVPVTGGPDNPQGNGFAVKQTALLSEKAARRDAAPGRYWKVINPERVGPLGHYPAYSIHPLGPVAQPIRPENAAGAQAGFLEHTLWATRHRESELYASGQYVTTDHPQGLPQWTERDDPLEGEDLVVWYTLGTLHVPRAEEWPIMPVAHMGFTLEPHNFFEVNPAYG
jgi:primary-amine oxidase